MATETVDPAIRSPIGTDPDRLGRLRRWCVIAAVAIPALATIVMITAGLPDYGEYVASEQTPMTWLQSVVLSVSGAAAGLIAARAWIRSGQLWPWVVLAAGFLGLAADERFALHERLRDRVLADRLPDLIPWGSSGDIILPLYGVGGLFVGLAVLRALAPDRVARSAFFVGLAILAVAVAADTVDIQSYSFSVELAEQTIEEVVELLGQSMLLLGLTLWLLDGRDLSTQ